MRKNKINQNCWGNNIDNRIIRQEYLNSCNCIPHIQEARRKSDHIKKTCRIYSKSPTYT